MQRSIIGCVAFACIAVQTAAAQQQPTLTRTAAIDRAVAQNPRVAAAIADTVAAVARVSTARALPDPTLSASYTKDIPRYHVAAEMPVDQLWNRGPRVAAAMADLQSTRYKLRYEVASVTLDVDSSYTHALAAMAHSRLSARDAADADSLRKMAAARRDAGDASDLDVELAALAAGQAANTAASDSLEVTASLLELQGLLGTPAETVSIGLTDSLQTTDTAGVAAMGTGAPPLLVASGASEVDAAAANLRLQHHLVLGSPALTAGFDTGDPTGDEPGLLPTFGVSIPLPIFNRNRGPIAEANAARDRAVADLATARLESTLGIRRAQATFRAAIQRIDRDRITLQSAARVVSMSLTAYREGATPVANVLEAQRTAREVEGKYIDDVSAAAIAAATLRLLTLTPSTATP
jgi:cobalt-zinc-cadmium efflux system outer membrane protein